MYITKPIFTLQLYVGTSKFTPNMVDLTSSARAPESIDGSIESVFQIKRSRIQFPSETQNLSEFISLGSMRIY